MGPFSEKDIAALWAIVGISSVMLAPAAQAQSWSMYSGYNSSSVIPFFPKDQSVTVPPNYMDKDTTIWMNVQVTNPSLPGQTGASAPFRIDTGSVGMIVPAYLVPGYTNTATAQQGFTSSGNYAQGYWTNLAVSFPGATLVNGKVPTATIPVFVELTAVYANADSTPQNPTTHSVDCTSATTGDKCIFQLGIGYGRSNATDTVTATPSYNPLLNIDGMQGPNPTMRAGYAITPKGVEVGLTSSNAGAGFSVVKLQPNAAIPGDWLTLPGQFYVNNQRVEKTNAALLDSGIPYVWGDLAKLVTPSTSNCPAGTKGGQSCAPSATAFTITLGMAGNPNVVSYSYTEGTTNTVVAPSYTRSNESPTLNTGMFVFGGFSYFYDAAGGYVGLKSLNNAEGSVVFSVSLAILGAIDVSPQFSSDLPIYVAGDSALKIPDAAVFSGAVTGPGALTLAGPGQATLSGPVTLPGGIQVAQGQLGLTGFTQANVTVATGAQLVNASTLLGAVTSSGSVSNSGLLIGSVTNAGSVTNSGTIEGIVKNQGTLSNTGTIKGTVENSGTLSNDGVISGSVFNAATLTGSGTINGDLVSTGHVSPGHSVGNVQVNGNVTLAAGSLYTAELGAGGVADVITATGSISSDSSRLRILPLDGFRPTLGDSYRVMTADAGIFGRFILDAAAFGQASSLYPFLSGGLAISGTGVNFTLGRSGIAFADLATTANQAAVAAAADRTAPSGPLVSQIATLNRAEAPAAFMQMEGDIYASAQSVFLQQSSYLRTAIAGRLLQAERPGRESGPQAQAMPGFAGLTLWGQGYGGWGTNDGNLNVPAVSSSIGGFIMGLDGALFDWRVGLAAGFNQSRYAAAASSGTSDNYDLALYAARSFGPLNLRLGGAYTWHDISTARSIAFANLTQGYEANYGGGTGQLFGEVGYAIPLQMMGAAATLEPILGVSQVRLSLDGFSEGVGVAALSGSRSHFDMTSTTAGLRGSLDLSAGSVPVVLSGLIGWQHAFGDLTPTSTLAFASGSSPFVSTGVPVAADTLVLAAGLSTAVTKDVSLAVSYSGQIASGVTENAVKGAITWAF